MCVCGVVKADSEELISHVQRRHSNDVKSLAKQKKSQKLHLRIIHLLDFSHYCWYCDYGRHDKNNVISHMVAKHGYRKSYQCSLCNKTFPTYFHLNRHTSMCGVAKSFASFLCCLNILVLSKAADCDVSTVTPLVYKESREKLHMLLYFLFLFSCIKCIRCTEVI